MDNNVQEDLVIDELSRLNGDFKATVIAAELINNGIPRERIFFRNISTFKRFISKDVERMKWEGPENSPGQLTLEVNREGLYDMLPEGLTHTSTKKPSQEEALKEFARHREEEAKARKFFSPFENEFLHRSLQIEEIERETFSNKNPATNRYFFSQMFGDCSLLTDVQVLMLMHILPLAARIRGNTILIAQTLTRLLNYYITVESKILQVCLSDTALRATHLGERALGIDAVLSDRCTVLAPGYLLIVHDIPETAYLSFVAGGENHNVLEFILPYFFPAGSEVRIDLRAEKECEQFKTSGDNSLCYLGFNSYVN